MRWCASRAPRACAAPALEPVPSLALGTSPVTLLEMATAYSTLAALGQYRAPLLIDAHHRPRRQGAGALRRQPRASEFSIERSVAEQLVDVMRGVIDRGTGTALRNEFGVRGDLAGKTGTTQNNTDGWFIAMNPDLVAGAWVGFNDQRVTIRSNYWGQGAHNALRIVGDFMRQGAAREAARAGPQLSGGRATGARTGACAGDRAEGRTRHRPSPPLLGDRAEPGQRDPPRDPAGSPQAYLRRPRHLRRRSPTAGAQTIVSDGRHRNSSQTWRRGEARRARIS